MRPVVRSLLLLVTLAGCSGGTAALQAETRDTVAAKLQPAITTEQDVRQAYGEPASQSSENGRTTWSYGLRTSQPHATNFIPIVNFFDSGGEGTDRLLIVTFGPDSRLVEYLFRASHTNSTSGIDTKPHT